MTLSWGHRPPELEPQPRPSHARWIVIIAVAAVAIATAFVATRSSTVDDQGRVAIAALLDVQRRALASGDLDAYMATIDPTRLSLRTCEEQRFEYDVLQKIPVASHALGRTEAYRGYIRTWLHDLSGLRRIFVRSDGGHWYQTEPTTSDLGGDVTREFAGISVTATDAESDLIDPVGHDLDRVRAAVETYAPAPPTRLFSVRIATLATNTGRCFVAGTAQLGYDGAQLTMREVTVTPDYGTMTYESMSVLIHEALHWIQFDHSIDASMAMDWWMVEGWPFRIAQDPSGAARSSAVCGPNVPSYLDMRSAPPPGTPELEVERRYVIAAMLVERLATQYGPNAYWTLVDAFGKEIEPARAYQTAFGTDGATFYRAWQSDMQAHYC